MSRRIRSPATASRRRFLSLAGASLASCSAGCTALFGEGEQFRLWFVRVLNSTTRSVDIGLRVRRDSDVVFRDRFEIPTYRSFEQPDPNPTFANEPSVRFVAREWEPRPGSYDVEYRLGGNGAWENLRLGSFDVRNVGVDVQLMPSRTSIGAGARVVEFQSRERVDSFFRQVANESAGNQSERSVRNRTAQTGAGDE